MTKNIFYNDVKAGWDKNFEKRNEEALPHSEIFLEGDLFCTLVPPPARMLDSGCGDGALSILLSQKKYAVTAIDYSEQAINIAHTSATKKRLLNKPQFFVCPMEGPLPFDSATFDAVIMSKSLHCVLDEHREQAMSESLRVLKANGIIYLSLLSVEDEFMPRSSWEEISKNTWKDVWFNRIFHFYSNDEINTLAITNSLEILSHKIIKQIKTQNKFATFHILIARKSSTSSGSP